LFLKVNVLLNSWVAGSLVKLKALILVELARMLPNQVGIALFRLIGLMRVYIGQMLYTE
jgi:hypothetical protein